MAITYRPPVYCPECHTHVAPHDPEKKLWEGCEYHGSCFRKRKGLNFMGLHDRQPERKPRQTYFRFQPERTVH